MATSLDHGLPFEAVRLRPGAAPVPGRRQATVDTLLLGPHSLTRVTLGSGWQFSMHGQAVSRHRRACRSPHVGVVIAGTSCVVGADGSETLLGPGDVYTLSGTHDWRVEGDDPVVVLGVGATTPACAASNVAGRGRQ